MCLSFTIWKVENDAEIKREKKVHKNYQALFLELNTSWESDQIQIEREQCLEAEKQR